MPNVPKVPGVPTLQSYLATGAGVILLTTDALRSLVGPLITRWGIFRNGIPVIVADNTVSVEFRRDFSISDYPTEQGGFQSYNKVGMPGDIRCRFSAGGSEANRQAFLASISSVIFSTDLFDVVTPEVVYLKYCFSHVDYVRSARNGVGLIVADLWLTEIRLTSTSTFPSTQQPGVAGQQAVGNVQPQTPSEPVLAMVGNGEFF